MNHGNELQTDTGYDDETAGLLTDSIERILSDLCTTTLLRASESQEQGDTVVKTLWAALEAAGLSDALRDDESGDGALGWAEVRGLIEACGRWGLPAPLPETLAAQALCRMAGAQTPEGISTIAVASREGDRVIAHGVAHARLASKVLVTLPSEDDESHCLWQFELARAAVRPSVGIAEDRAELCWLASEGRELGVLPRGIEVLSVGAAIRCAQIAGACARVLQMSTTYASDRVQFGRPISKFQAIQQQLALAGEWTAMAAMASQLALAGPGLALDPHRVAAAKQVASTAVQQCCEIAHAVHGAIGVTAEYDLQLFTRRLWTWAADFGSALHWSRALGSQLLDRAPEYCWDEVVRISSV
jgi:acyl-CoA dehydrogenase